MLLRRLPGYPTRPPEGQRYTDCLWNKPCSIPNARRATDSGAISLADDHAVADDHSNRLRPRHADTDVYPCTDGHRDSDTHQLPIPNHPSVRHP